tara:strand:- start:632 stop:886 length:255 start_codon:yes stop_codon:yes gene_type:complete
MTTIRVIFYKNATLDYDDTPEDVIERCYEGITDLSMEDWIIQHNESRGADINDKDMENEETSALWEDEDEFIVYEHQEIKRIYK